MRHPLSAGARQYVDAIAASARAQGRPICLDTAALIAYVAWEEPAAVIVEPLLSDSSLRVVISTLTLAEAVTRPAMSGDFVRVQAIHDALLALPGCLIVDVDQRHAIETAIVRGLTGLKLPDAAVVATARLAQAAALVGNDRQWRNKPLGVPYHHIDDILALP
jgi:PIN domain nuclease of toxin-antitoxin system